MSVILSNEQIKNYFEAAIKNHPDRVLARLRQLYPENPTAYFRGQEMTETNKKLMQHFLVRRAANSGNAAEFIKNF